MTKRRAQALLSTLFFEEKIKKSPVEVIKGESEPDKSAQRKGQSKSNVVAEQPAKDTKTSPTPPVDDSVQLFRVRIDAIKPTRKDAGALVSELKDKGFSATVLPLAGGFVVQTGAFRDRKSAETLQRTLLDNGYDASISN